MDDLEQERQRVETEERGLGFERCGQRPFHSAAAGATPESASWIERNVHLA